MRGFAVKTRAAYWLVPLFVLAASVAFQACGDDDDGVCGDTQVLATEEACEEYAAEFDCSDFSYNSSNSVCTVSNCFCAFVVDDIDDVF